MSDYTLQAHSKTEEEKEIKRLDDLHDSIMGYLGGRLSFAPLESSSPSSILELGSGSGAWAIQAAHQFPDAQITAVDMTNLPDRPLPSNLVFERVDLTKPLPFGPASFDIIHARLVMMHLPHAVEILERVAEHLKPGGWLLLEDPDHECLWDDGGPPGPKIQAVLGVWHGSTRKRGVEPCIGRMFETELGSLGTFGEVNSHYVDIPLSGQSSVPAENQLGDSWQRTIKHVMSIVREGLVAHGVTPEDVDGALAELGDPTRKLTTRMYFTWSKKL